MKKGIDYIGVSVGALILNDRGQILLTKRSQNATNERGCWEAPGGGVNFGEKLEDAVRREVKEELGVEVDILFQFAAHNHLLPKEKQHWVASSFLLRIKDNKSPVIMEPDKCDELGWFDLNKLPRPLSIITQQDVQPFLTKTETLTLGRYKHFKGKVYEVIAIARHSESLEFMVVYKALYENKMSTYWVRPLVIFMEKVTYKGNLIPRFIKV